MDNGIQLLFSGLTILVIPAFAITAMRSIGFQMFQADWRDGRLTLKYVSRAADTVRKDVKRIPKELTWFTAIVIAVYVSLVWRATDCSAYLYHPWLLVVTYALVVYGRVAKFTEKAFNVMADEASSADEPT